MMTRSSVMTVLFLALGLLLMALAPAAPANLLINGDFERAAEEGGAANWFTPSWGAQSDAEAKLVGGGYQSPYCLLLAGQTDPTLFVVHSPPVDIAELPTRQLLFTCYYRTREQPGAQISLMTFTEDFRQREWGTPAVQTEVQSVPHSAGWNLLSWHFEAVPGARQIIVMIRITGQGQLYLDKAALRPYPDELAVQVRAVGMLDQLPDMCLTSLHVTNLADRERKLRVVLVAVGARGAGVRTQHDATIAARGEGEVSLPYRYPLGRPHNVQVIVSDPDTDDIYEHQQVSSPGLIEAHFRQPAFRATILDGIPISQVEIVGRINAAENLAQRVKLSARIVDIDLEITEASGAIERPTPQSFVMQLPLDKLLTGDYTVRVRAELEDPRLQQTWELPLRRLTPSPSQVGYDGRNRLWLRGAPVLPRGLYHAMEPEDLAQIAAAGFNFVVVSARRASSALVQQADELGLAIVVSSPSLGSGAEPDARGGGLWHNLQKKFGTNAALLGWHLVPHPDQQAVPPAVMGQLYRDLRQISPAHPTIVSLTSPSRLRFYTDFADIIAARSLPVPDVPITAVGQIVDAAQRAVEGRKPVWADIQASGPGWYRDAGLAIEGPGRAPSAAELRAMTYLALVHGAKGITFYGFQIPAYTNTKAFHLVRDAPHLWEALAVLNRELQWLAPILLGGQRALLPPASDGALELATWQHDEALYLIAVNTSPRGLVCHFQVPAAAGKSLQALFEDLSLPAAADGTFQDSFAPHETRIYASR